MPDRTLEIYGTGPDIKRKMLELIEGAGDYLLIDSFLVVTDSITREVMEALRRKHQSGVRVYLLADSSSRYMETGEPGFVFLEEAGIPNVEYNPLRIYKLLAAPIMLPRDHRKFWIVDGRVLFLGGANIFSTSLEAAEEGGNIDFMVTVESADAIRQMIDSFVATWNRSSPRKLRAGDFAVRLPPTENSDLRLVDQNKHVGRRHVVVNMIRDLFSKATEVVWLVQPYTFVTRRLLRQIRELTEREVEVHVMLAGKVQAPRFHYASFYGIRNLLEAGAKVWVYRPEKGALHAKAIVVDGRWASVGSANLNTRSYHFSKEANLVFSDRDSVSKVVQCLEELKTNCRPVGAEEAKRYRTASYFLAWLWMQLTG